MGGADTPREDDDSSGLCIHEEGEDHILEDLVVVSPAKRVRVKAPTPLVAKRSHKYCQKEDCVSNRFRPDHPAAKHDGIDTCVWCDESFLAQYVQEATIEIHVKKTLESFKKNDTAVYRMALEKLGAHELSGGSRFCKGSDCV